MITKPKSPIKKTSVAMRRARKAAAATPVVVAASRECVEHEPAAAASIIATASSRPKAHSKIGIVLSLLEDSSGASLDKLVEVTGWLPHTTRAALTGLRKRGFPVVLHPAGGAGSSVYRVQSDAA